MKNNYTIEIDGIPFLIQEEVAELINNISLERDMYIAQIKCSLSAKGHTFEKVKLSQPFNELEYIDKCTNCGIETVIV